MSKNLEDIYLDSLPTEIRYIKEQIMRFTQIVPPYNIAAYSEYLARGKVLLDIDEKVSAILHTCDEKDEYYYMEIIPLIEKVNKIMELQRNSK